MIFVKLVFSVDAWNFFFFLSEVYEYYIIRILYFLDVIFFRYVINFFFFEINYRKGKFMILRGRKRVVYWLLGDNFDSCCYGYFIEFRFDVKVEWLLKKVK